MFNGEPKDDLELYGEFGPSCIDYNKDYTTNKCNRESCRGFYYITENGEIPDRLIDNIRELFYTKDLVCAEIATVHHCLREEKLFRDNTQYLGSYKNTNEIIKSLRKVLNRNIEMKGNICIKVLITDNFMEVITAEYPEICTHLESYIDEDGELCYKDVRRYGIGYLHTHYVSIVYRKVLEEDNSETVVLENIITNEDDDNYDEYYY